MDIILLILAGVVVYYLYVTLQEYLKNPISVQSKDLRSETQEYDLSQDPYIQMNPFDKIRKTEFGIMVAIISKTLNQDNQSMMREILINATFKDMGLQMSGVENAAENLKEIYNSKDLDSLERLCKDFLQVTYGEYKKRLKFVEFLFALAYADGKLNEEEKENIIDVAAFLELSNEDFNKIYDDFDAQNGLEITMDRSKALEIFGMQEDFSQQELEEKFKDLVLSAKQNILDVKNLNKSFATESFKKLCEIRFAYNLLSHKETPL
ncbi:hypothetical protein BKH41_05375 [Helicobacter sp. 12S02232-10]|uniref:TerB family tellurite resistance protein n=1 Tax=Helicobacter sp. 12S02232-10 TaxID=1476197 RepID=UPI000BA725B0|nr:TerB family tellurite resistance protein [Helicobacter sp. 12S02232-10]PAF48699.1 hypothetical protein BKH41_05375 [Helicobacter sp. 12S02232-10]